jgi:hypothetical protein
MQVILKQLACEWDILFSLAVAPEGRFNSWPEGRRPDHHRPPAARSAFVDIANNGRGGETLPAAPLAARDLFSLRPTIEPRRAQDRLFAHRLVAEVGKLALAIEAGPLREATFRVSAVGRGDVEVIAVRQASAVSRGMLLGMGSAPCAPPSSSITASHCCWCIVLRAMRKLSMSFMPGSEAAFHRRVASTRPVLSAATLQYMSAAMHVVSVSHRCAVLSVI